DGPHGMGERPLETRVAEPGKAIAYLLPRACQLVGCEAGGGFLAGALDRVAEPALVFPGGARRDHRDGPVRAVLDRRADGAAAPQPFADLLKEPGVGIGADDLQGERQRQHAARVRRCLDDAYEVALRQVLPTEPHGALRAAARQPWPRRRARTVGREDA